MNIATKSGTHAIAETLGSESTASKLRSIVATWYFILRNIALLILMLILIFIGIKIVIGSTAGEKAKYKERLMDWLVAICLLFIMHYIMIFAIQIVESITKIIRDVDHSCGVAITLDDKKWENLNKTTEVDGVERKLLDPYTEDGRAILIENERKKQ